VIEELEGAAANAAVDRGARAYVDNGNSLRASRALGGLANGDSLSGELAELGACRYGTVGEETFALNLAFGNAKHGDGLVFPTMRPMSSKELPG
jgi:hypothetical protein